ncbi:MAG: hypothetical protein SFY32_08965 [Bacteroidota bacterium]|nr:hypothetical protein [Bacteroidota bacterium]
MESNEKMIDLLLDMVHQQKETNQRLAQMDKRFEKMDARFEQMDKRFENIEKQIFKNTAAVGELRISVMRLADENLRIDAIERRLYNVESKLAS